MTKHDNKTADELIVDNAPEGATHYDEGEYMKTTRPAEWMGRSGSFDWIETEPESKTRSLADIAELIELRKKNAELEAHNLGLTKTLVEFEQQAKGATDICNKALEKIVIPKEMSALRSEYFKAGITALAYAIEHEAKQLKGGNL